MSDGWRTFTAGQEILCPAMARDRRASRHDGDRRQIDRPCDRVMGEVGPGLIVSVRVHPGGDRARPNPFTRTQDCRKCGHRVEFAEQREERAA